MPPPTVVVTERRFRSPQEPTQSRATSQEQDGYESPSFARVFAIIIMGVDHFWPGVLGARLWIDTQRCPEMFVLRRLLKSYCLLILPSKKVL